MDAPKLFPQPIWRERRIEALIEALSLAISGGGWRYDCIALWAQELHEHALWKLRDIKPTTEVEDQAGGYGHRIPTC